MVESGPSSRANAVSTRVKPWLQPAPNPPLTGLRIRTTEGRMPVTISQVASSLALSTTTTPAAGATERMQSPITRPLW